MRYRLKLLITTFSLKFTDCLAAYYVLTYGDMWADRPTTISAHPISGAYFELELLARIAGSCFEAKELEALSLE